jgi:hypothetical protein
MGWRQNFLGRGRRRPLPKIPCLVGRHQKSASVPIENCLNRGVQSTGSGTTSGTTGPKHRRKQWTTALEQARRINYLEDFSRTLDLAILVRVQASPPISLTCVSLPSRGRCRQATALSTCRVGRAH